MAVKEPGRWFVRSISRNSEMPSLIEKVSNSKKSQFSGMNVVNFFNQVGFHPLKSWFGSG